MKKTFFKNFILLILGIQLFIFNKTNVMSYNSPELIEKKSVAPNKSCSEVKKIELGKGLECVLKFKYYPEYIKSTDETGAAGEYSRSVSAVGTLYSNKDGIAGKKLLEHKVKVTFTYDKKSRVKIDCSDDDIDCHKKRLDDSNKRWKMAQSHEILYDDGICIVSEMFTVFKQRKLSDEIRYVENSHVDFMCTPQGYVAVNTKSS